MSTSIENRVVGLQFDNRNFEKNVGQTLTSLDRLEKGLKLKGAGRGLEELDKAASRMDFSKLGKATELITKRLSTMGIVGMNVLNRISNKIIGTAESALKAFTIQPITDGFSEYELKMGSVQTIVASTGESLGTVNAYLEELNKYSDKTIYSFKDMTSSIGKFTNAGVPLEQAVLAIQGISNEAAVSGANAEEASRAMYNFSQALSAGYVKLIDWKSIENANMATREFKQELINTAVAMGTLKEANDGMYKAGKTSMNATKNFNDSLQEQWMTSEVLIETLRKYADATTDIGKKAFAAAQDIKTYHQLMDTIKESIGSGWAQISEIIFGDLEEAKELWTSIGGAISDFVENAFGGITEFLSNNLQSNHKKFLKSGAIADVEKFNDIYAQAVKDTQEPMRKEVENNDKIIQERQSSLKAWKDYYHNLELIEEQGYFINELGYKQNQIWNEPAEIKHGADEVNALIKRNEELNKQLSDNTIKADIYKESLLSYYDEISDEAVLLEKAGFDRGEALKEMGITSEQFNTMMKWRNGIRDGTIDVEALVASFDEVARRKKIFNALGNTLKYVGSMFKPITNAFKNVFFNAKNDELWLGKLIDKWDTWASSLKISETTMTNLTEAFEKIFGWVYKLGDWAIPKLKAGFTKLYDFFKRFVSDSYDFISSAIEYIDPIQMLTDAYNWLAEAASDAKDAIVDIFKELKARPKIGSVLTALENVYDKFSKLLSMDAIDDNGKLLTKGYQKFWYALKQLPEMFETAFNEAGIKVKDFVQDFKDYFKEASETSKNAFSDIYNNIKTFTANVGTAFGNFTSWIKDNLDIIISGAYVTLMAYKILKFVTFLDNILGHVEDFAVIIGKIPKAIINAINRISKAEAFKRRAEGIKAFASALESVAIAIAIISLSVKLLSDLDVTAAIKGLGGILAIIVMLGGLAFAMHKFGDFKGSLSLGSLAFAIFIIVAAANMITQIEVNPKTIGPAIGVLIGVVIAFGALLAIVNRMKPVSIKALGSSFAVMIAAFALYALIVAVKMISSVDLNDGIIDTLVKLGIVISIMWDLMKILSKGSTNSAKAGIGLLAMALSIILMIQAFKMLEKLDPRVLIRGILGLVAMYVPLNLLMKAVSRSGPNAHKAAAAIIAIAIAIIPLVYAVKLLAAMDWHDAAKGIAELASIMLALGLFMRLSSGFKVGLKSLIGVVAIIATVGIILGGLSVLSHYIGKENLYSAAESLGGVLVALAIAFGVLSKFTITTLPGIGKFALQVGIMLAAIFALSLILKELANNIDNPDAALKSAIGLVVVIAGLGILMGVGAAIGKIAGHALIGVGAIILTVGVIMGLVGLVAYGVGHLSPSAKKAISDGIPTMIEIAGAIGSMIYAFNNAMVGGDDRSAIEKFADQINNMMDTIKSISDKAAGIPSDFGKKLLGISGGLTAFMGADMVAGFQEFMSLFGMGQNFDTLTKNFKAFGEGLAALSEGMGDAKLSNISVAAGAGEKLANVVKTLSFSNWKGEKPDTYKLVGFATGIKNFAKAIGDISDAEYTIDSGKITQLATAGTELATMATAIPNAGGKIAEWFGDNTLDDFGTQISGFAEALSKADDYWIVTTSIDNLAAAGTQLATMATAIPESGGKIADFFGDANVKDFGSDISAFASSLATASKEQLSMQTFDELEYVVNAAKNAADKAIAVDTGKLASFETDMEAFIGWFSTITYDGTMDTVDGLNTVLDGMLTTITDYDAKFAEAGKTSVESYFGGFSSNEGGEGGEGGGTSDVDSIAASVISSLDVSEEATAVGGYVAQGFAKGISNGVPTVTAAAVAAGAAAIAGLMTGTDSESPSKYAANVGRFVGQGFALGIDDTEKSITNSATNLGTKSIQAMSDAVANMSAVINSDVDLQPVIRPVMDLSDVKTSARELSAMYNNDQVTHISRTTPIRKPISGDTEGSNATSGGVNVSYVQNNYSPKALSRIDIYRQTKNQISQLSQISNVKGVVKRV